jgi:molybdopterin/thiamine biosynthesis adenylyltransferase/TusA-related sulfurtransferase
VSAAPSVLVVGTGGIGAPCAWALARAGARLVVVDPDVVDASNLPRQVLFAPGDVGSRKVEVAARRLRGGRAAVEPVAGAVDAATGPDLLARASVVVDATDGAAAKDLVNALAVRARVPLVHAAAVGSEGRLLDVPPGGRPCLACLFGATADAPEAGGDCASLGVWPALPGLVGFLAASAALARAAAPAAPSAGLRVLDLRDARAATLRVREDAACSVCGAGARAPAAAAAARAGSASAAGEAPAQALDLTEESCPTNLLRARRALERTPPGAVVEILLGEDGADSVPDGIAALGHEVLLREPRGRGARLRVRAAGGACAGPAAPAADPMEDAWLRRYARQIVLPEVGEPGQRTWQGARVLLAGGGDAFTSAAVFLACAGVGALRLFDPSPVGDADDGSFPFPAGSRGRRRDEVLADALARHAGTAATALRHAVVEEVESVDAVAIAGGAVGAAGVLACRSQEAGRPWAAVAGDGAGGAALRAVGDGDLSPFPDAPRTGPLALAGGALLADATLRRLLDRAAPAGGVVLRADATVERARPG